MKLSIITLNYKTKDMTDDCIASVYDEHKEEFINNNFELIAVDNDSQDGSVEGMEKFIKQKKYKNILIIANNKNAGFGTGNNIGAEKARGEYLLFLNNDTKISGTGFLDMIMFLDMHPNAGILGGLMKNFDGSQQPSTGKFYTPLWALLLLLGMQRFGLIDKNPKTVSRVDWVKGGALMIRRDVFQKLRGFDEHIFMYTEDMELCYRAQKAGSSVYFYPDVNIFHKEHGSSNRTFAIVNIYQNLSYFYKKHRSHFEYEFIRFLLQAKAVILIAIGRLTGNSYFTQTYEKALASIR